MSNIPGPIGQREWELIRDRLGLILAQELATQAQLDYDDVLFELPDVYIERYVPFNHTEMPAINVMVAQGEYTQETQQSQDGTWTFYVDGYATAKDEDGQRGDQYAAMRLQRIMGICQAIIMDSRFKTLLFEPGSISNRSVKSILMADPTKAMEASNAVMARMTVEVRVSDGVELVDAIELADYTTQVQLSDTALGYLWGGSAVTPPVPLCDPATIVNSDDTYSQEVASGTTFELADINLTVDGQDLGTFPAAVDIVTTLPGGLTVTFNYPYTPTEAIYNDYDIGWRQANGLIPAAPTSSQYMQELDPSDPWKIRWDDSATTGITEHLFRFVGINKGYMIWNPVTTTPEFYLADGTPSDEVTVTGKDGGTGFVIDRLTGIAQAYNNQVQSGGGVTGAQIMSALYTTDSFCGYTGGWWVPSAQEFLGWMLPQTYGLEYYPCWRNTQWFGYGTTMITSQGYLTIPATNFISIAPSTMSISTWARTQATVTGRYYLPCRIFDGWPLT